MWYGKLLSKALEGGTAQFVLVVGVLILMAVLGWLGKVMVTYLKQRMEREGKMQDTLMEMFKSSTDRANHNYERTTDALKQMVDADHRFQARSIEAMGTIREHCTRIEKSNGQMSDEHDTMAQKLSKIEGWIQGHA